MAEDGLKLVCVNNTQCVVHPNLAAQHTTVCLDEIIIRWRNGQFFEAPKTMKTFVYVYNTALLLVLGISKEDFKGFLKPLQAF